MNMNDEPNNSNPSEEPQREAAPVAPGKQDGDQKDKVVTDKPADATPEPVKAALPATK